jgi:hypothetical protein
MNLTAIMEEEIDNLDAENNNKDNNILGSNQ